MKMWIYVSEKKKMIKDLRYLAESKYLEKRTKRSTF